MARTEHNTRRISDEVISFPLMPELRQLSGVVLFSLLLGISVLCVYVEMVACRRVGCVYEKERERCICV